MVYAVFPKKVILGFLGSCPEALSSQAARQKVRGMMEGSGEGSNVTKPNSGEGRGFKGVRV